MKLADLPPLTKLPFWGVVLPSITISDEDRAHFGAKPGCDNEEFIRQLCRVGYLEKIVKRFPKAKDRKVYDERVVFELDTIKTLGFTNYLLMVWDICRFADKADIPRGPGRGSVSSSLVCHLIGVTELDPIEHGLFFTRFLSKARAKTTVVDGITYVDGGLVPDVDMDFDYYRRSEVFEYLANKYPGQTAFTLTTGTLTSKALIQDLIKVYEGGTKEQGQEASDMIEKDAGIPEEIEVALADDPDDPDVGNARFKEWAKNHEETVELAMDMSGLNRSEGRHASAFLICAKPIDQLIPLQSAVDDETGERFRVSGFDMYSAQEVVLKFDILGLKTLSVTKQICDLLGIKPQDINIHHESIYRELQDFQNRYGVFQLETFAQGNAATKVKPRDFSQLAAVLAIARPGAFAFIDQYVKYVNEGEFTSVHPLIDDILRPTGGVCVYQEQLLAMLVRVGMTPDDAEMIRKVVGKKQLEKLPEAKAKIEAACKANDRPLEIVDLLMKIATDSAKYQFAAAHAAAYAIITARTLYLKLNHTIEFWWATLQMNRHDSKKYEGLATIEKEMRITGYKLLPPKFSSSMDFAIEGPKEIRFALGMVRGISDKKQEKLLTFISSGGIKEGANKFAVFQALKNAGLDIGVVCALIQAGCMEDHERYEDENGKPFRSRSRVVLEACTWNLLTDKEKTIANTVGDKPEVQWDVIKALKYLSKQLNEKGKPLVKESRLITLRKRYAPYAEIYEMNSRNERLANYFYERKVLGFSYSDLISDIFGEEIDGLTTAVELRELPKESRVRMIGFAVKPMKAKTKRGNDEFKFDLSDETGVVRVKAFNARIDQIEKENGRLVEEGDLLIVSGKLMSEDTLFVERMGPYSPSLCAIQTTRIYTKLGELGKTREKAASTAAEQSAPAAA